MKLFGLFCFVTMVMAILMENLDGAVAAPFGYLKNEELHVSHLNARPSPSIPSYKIVASNLHYYYSCNLVNGGRKTVCVLQNPPNSTKTTSSTQKPQTEINQKQNQEQNEDTTIYVSVSRVLGSRIRRWLKGEIHLNQFYDPLSLEEAKGLTVSDFRLTMFTITLVNFVLFVIAHPFRGRDYGCKPPPPSQSQSKRQNSKHSNKNDDRHVENIPMIRLDSPSLESKIKEEESSPVEEQRMINIVICGLLYGTGFLFNFKILLFLCYYQF